MRATPLALVFLVCLLYGRVSLGEATAPSSFLYSCKDRVNEQACTAGACECVWCNGACEESPPARSRQFKELLEGEYQGYCTMNSNDCKRRACYAEEARAVWHYLKYALALSLLTILAVFSLVTPVLFFNHLGIHPYRTGVVSLILLPLTLYWMVNTDPYAHCAALAPSSRQQ